MPTATRVTPLHLGSTVRDAIDAHAVADYPREACGLLIGKHDASTTKVERVAACGNLAVERLADRYVLDPDDFLAADSAARRDGLDIVGIWHSHPDHPARPSPTDLEAAWPGYAYLIIAVTASGVVDRRAWRLEEGKFIEQPLSGAEVDPQS